MRTWPAPAVLARGASALILALGLAACSGDEGPPRPDLEQVRQALALPRYRGPLKARVDRQSGRRDLVLEWVSFEGRRDQRVPALVCYLEGARFRPAPVVLCMPGSTNRKEDLIQPLDLLGRLAEAGFFAVSIDRPYHGQRPGNPDLAIRQKGLGPVWGEYVYDLMRTIDYVATRSEADADRLGILGLSLGGMEALLMAALDPRVDVAVSVSGQVAWEPIFRAGAWPLLFGGLELTRQLQARNAGAEEALSAFLSEMPELRVLDAAVLAPALAPKPVLLITGGEDPLAPPAAARHTFEQALPGYRSGGMEDHLALWIEPGAGHGLTRSMATRAVAWLERWL
ncbi:MAG: alpha/beta fold hydrolase [Gemmatimonadota bacterium]